MKNPLEKDVEKIQRSAAGFIWLFVVLLGISTAAIVTMAVHALTH